MHIIFQYVKSPKILCSETQSKLLCSEMQSSLMVFAHLIQVGMIPLNSGEELTRKRNTVPIQIQLFGFLGLLYLLSFIQSNWQCSKKKCLV